jgi:ubiquinone/menaquinone biosynthesis C-methylase UbiE
VSGGDLDRTRAEFTLQAGPMTRGATFNAAAAIEPFVRLLGTPLPDRVLDLACGPGIVSAALARAGVRVVGLDATPGMLEAARARCAAEGLEAEFREGRAEALPFPDGGFPAATTRLSLHHFETPESVLAELRRVLEHGAVLVVGDIVASDEPAEARLHDALEVLRDPSHVRLLPVAELTGALEAAGFRVEAIEAWDNPKTFSEWAAVVAEARSLGPVREVMLALAGAGVRAGVDLRVEGDEVCFVHHWRFLRAVAV